jgi:hypothetical protein
MRTAPALMLICATLAAAGPLCAAGRDEERRERMPESVRRIENETGGRVLQVRPMQRGDREIYRVKVLTPEGRVRVMQDDPRRRMREPVPTPVRAPAPAPSKREDR